MSRYDWGETNSAIGRLKKAVEPARRRIITHPLYGNFMSLLKTLQAQAVHERAAEIPHEPVV
jgi:hypothetical protein